MIVDFEDDDEEEEMSSSRSFRFLVSIGSRILSRFAMADITNHKNSLPDEN